MTEVLDRPTTVTGHDVWRDDIQAKFPTETPVVRPVGKTESFDRLLHSVFTRTSGRVVVVTSNDGVVIHGSDAADLVQAMFGPNQAEKTHPATAATEALAEWLQTSLDSVVALVGISPSTRAHWRKNPDAPIRPSKSGRLLRLHSAVGLLVGELGLERARAKLIADNWLSTPLDDQRLSALEATVRDALLPDGLQPPAYLLGGGLNPNEVLARMAGSGLDEAHQRLLDTPEQMDDAAEGS
ncbi:hypothetical protein QWY28_06600 [Nocardioides sp. SOB77]|uniref:Uncharacterized protein n=1 Tax=Nocardioides oceani TaxID=3058369 RepID=A0ABT8FDW0_9ACTN|nr:hypothetical protein [Nocardioides oceani]MDN4172605.1 hypothetical protein [Nocardioides oceani]